jgi:phage I-like protein
MKNTTYALTACLNDLNGNVPSEIQLTPSGTFKAKDGRPHGLDGWQVNAQNSKNVTSLANNQTDKFVIDYEHQTLYAKQNGQPAPAAGWFGSVEYREGLGLFATNVEWTGKAALAIQNKEYRYISPVISYDNKTGNVQKIHMAALVNNPALDGMKDLTALAEQHFSTPQEPIMDKDKEIAELKAQISDLKKQLDESKSKAACADTQTVDLSQYMPITQAKALQDELTALATQVKDKEVAEIIEAALKDGRLLATQKDWANELGKSNLSSLKTFVSQAQPVAALSGMQTRGIAPKPANMPHVKVPAGVLVDNTQAALHEQITAYQNQHKVDFQTAIIALGV